MKIKLHEIPVREVVAGYKDSAENGVVGYDGRLNIRPAFQREFIYKDKQRDEVIRTITKNFPLNVMYWVKNDDGNFEVLDGQQRTISICQYVQGDFSINHYMSQHQHDTNCNELWLYFQTVINWVKATFPKYRSKLMKGLEWGIFYNKYGTGKYDPKALESRIIELIEDYRNGYISNQKGIYEYLFDGQERHLNIRAFSPEMARAAYERQKGICPKCGKHFEIEEMQADHITPWSKGGKTTAENCQMLCADCNRRKSNI